MSEPQRTMSIEEFRQRLGAFGEQFTEDELLKLRDDGYKLADAIIDWWLRYRHRKAGADSTNPEHESY